MAYDASLAERIRIFTDSETGITEKKMFGGLAFLINGNMAIAASGQGGLLVRVNPAQTDTLLAASDAQIMEMRGKQMPGWLRVSVEYVSSDDELVQWIQLGTAYARSLPAKRPK